MCKDIAVDDRGLSRDGKRYRHFCFLVISGLLVSACSTPGGLMENGPIYSTTTSKTEREFSACFLDQFKSESIRPIYSPAPNGAMIEHSANTGAGSFTNWVVKIDESGSVTRVSAFGRTGSKDLERYISPCI